MLQSCEGDRLTLDSEYDKETTEPVFPWWSPRGLSPEECPDTAQRLAWHPQAFPASLSMFCLSSPRRYSSRGKTVDQTLQLIPLLV